MRFSLINPAIEELNKAYDSLLLDEYNLFVLNGGVSTFIEWITTKESQEDANRINKYNIS